MFVSEALKTHLEQSATINLQSLVLAEWNMNVPGNIFAAGNYRYRPTTVGSIYNTIPNTFDSLDIGDYYSDYSLIKSEIGWQPKIDIENGLMQTLRFYEQHYSHYLD